MKCKLAAILDLADPLFNDALYR